MIESYRFGRMVIRGRIYTSDLIILPDRILDGWWRKTGHRLCLEDLQEALQDNPDILIVGTGAFGRLRIAEEVEKFASNSGIELLSGKTKTAVKLFNELDPKKNTAGAFHLTC